VQQDGIAGLYLDAGGFLRRFQVGDRDVAFSTACATGRGTRLGEKILERQFRDRLRARTVVEMHGCIDMGAGNDRPCSTTRRRREFITVRDTLFVVTGEL